MKHCFTLFSFCLLFFSSGLYSQSADSSRISCKIKAEAYGEHHFYRSIRSSMPKAIRELRRHNNTLPVSVDTVTDNPMPHAVMYAAVKTVTRIGGKVELKADLYGEYRGFSYGSFNDNNTVVYPVLSASVRDSFTINRDFLKLHADVGQFLDVKIDEGLMIYNLDLQRLRTVFRYKNSQFTASLYADLFNGIGLGVDDLRHFAYTHFLNKDRAAIGFSYVMAAPPFAPLKYHTYLNAFAHVYGRNGAYYYGQVGFTQGFRRQDIFDTYKGANRQIAAVAGMEHRLTIKRFFITNKTEVRYYGHAYNAFHSDMSLRYRKPATSPEEMYNNTIGKYLYTLRKFITPFSQWAVFTEYAGYNLFAVSLTGNANYRLSEKFAANLNYDVNGIFAMLDKDFYVTDKRRSYFVYPFFKIAIQYIPIKEASVSLFITNKTMNLDLGYTSHYLTQKPFMGISFYIGV